jgi:hypothetical protein
VSDLSVAAKVGRHPPLGHGRFSFR